MEAMTLREIIAASDGRFCGSETLLQGSVSDIVIDSRAAKPGTLYVPIHGERFDGHDFIDAARAAGASCVLSEHPLSEEPYILVSDTLAALQRIAACYRSRFNIPVIAISGSVGKTSTKEMLAAVLSVRYNVLKTIGSMNNQTGVPLTLFRLDSGHDAAIIEMGTNHFGEIDALAKIVSPTVCMLTNIGVAHIEFFGSREGILKGKCEMLPYLRAGGHIIVNGDDDMLVTVPGAMRYGIGEGCDLRAVEIEEHGLDGMAFTAVYGDQSARVLVPSPGQHAVSNALAAMSAGLVLGMQLDELACGVASFEPPSGRMSIRHTDRYTVLDDSYNANPNSVMAAINVLEKVDGRRVAILGDMLELGAQTDEYHEVVGMYAARHGIDLILCVGPNSEQTFLGAHAIAPHRSRYFESVESLRSILPLLLREKDTVLVKGSRGMHLERIVALLTEE